MLLPWQVEEGFEVLREINGLEVDVMDRPKPPVSIADCGTLRPEDLEVAGRSSGP